VKEERPKPIARAGLSQVHQPASDDDAVINLVSTTEEDDEGDREGKKQVRHRVQQQQQHQRWTSSNCQEKVGLSTTTYHPPLQSTHWRHV